MANESNNTEDKVKDNQYFVYDDSNDYKEDKEKRSDALIKKYKEMADMRRDYEDIDIKDCIPTLDEMVQDDLMYELLEKVANGENEKEVLDAAFYVDEPPTKEVGYNAENNVFILKIPKMSFTAADKELNLIDGDTFRVPISSIIDSNDPFPMNNGESYDSFLDYCTKKGLIDPKAEDKNKKLQIRLVGTDCPEIPHYDVQLMKKTDIVQMTVAEAKKKNAVMVKYNYNSSTGSVTDRNLKDSDKLDFYKIKSGGSDKYHEIVGDGTKYIDANDRVSDSNYTYKKIIITDDSKKETLAGGYKAQKNMINLLSAGNVYVMLDANGAKANKTSSKYKLYYNHWWNVVPTIADMIDQWCSYSGETSLTKLSYSPFGTDGYGRFLGAAYAPRDGMYINIGKYNIADDTDTVARPDFTNSPELNNLGGDNAAVFRLDTYEKNNYLWLDSFSEITKEKYKARLEFHKQVTGIDFTKFRNCTMMIGDTLFLIPPQNIRSMSSIDYERVSIMRGKGSMVKNNTNRDMYLEVDLFFYNGSGVNGIATEVTMPNGEKVTYHMNGLRSLIAQFKVAPYLPIENQFINDVLGIEAVSLVNLNVSTVEGIPRLLRATLTMRDFNYRIYMPDIPIDYSSNEISEVSEMNPIFAKCFNWEVFRYYYQRMISYGEYQKEFDYNSYSYRKELYSKKEVLQPIYFCEKDGYGGSDLSFYIPDENWLKMALSIKKDKDFYGQNLAPTEFTPASLAWLDGLSKSAKCIDELTSSDVSNKIQTMYNDKTITVDAYAKEAYDKDTVSEEYPTLTVRNVMQSTRTHFKSDKKSNVFTNYVKPILKPIVDSAASSDAIANVNVDEVVDTKNSLLYYDIHLKLRTSDLSTIDMEAVKETVRDALGMSNIIGIFKNNEIVIKLQFKLKKSGSKFALDYSKRPTLVGRDISKESEKVKVNDMDILSAFSSGAIDYYGLQIPGTTITNNTIDTTYDYNDPAAMQFVSYVGNIEVQNLSFNMTNNFSDITLKVMDGFAPQYMGSSDISIELSFMTADTRIVSMINVLPAHAANIGKLYRRILSCWPIQVRNQYLQLAGINEVLIDLVEIETVEGFPGLFEVRMRMTSVDRTMRQREQMKKLDSNEESTTKATATISSYWDLDNALATAELYPDLDLPSLRELESYGYYFIRYKNTKQAYPDPDFYMTYGFPYTSYIIKKNLKDIFYNKVFHDEGKEKSELLDDTSFKFFDQMGMELYRKLDPVEGTVDGSGPGGISQNDLADEFDTAMEAIDEEAVETIKKAQKKKERSLEEQNCANLGDVLIYLTACDVQEGWTLKPGFTAPVVVNELNLDIEKLSCSGINHDNATEGELNNAYAQEVFDLRKEIIQAIDEYLSSPIDYGKYEKAKDQTAGLFSESKDPIGELIGDVVEKFAEESGGKKILQLLNPFEDTWKRVRDDWELKDVANSATGKDKSTLDYTKPIMVTYLTGFLYAAAKCISAEDTYTGSDAGEWIPKQFRTDNWGNPIKDKDGKKIPNCKVERNGKNVSQAESYQEAIDCGIQWGMFQIKRYRASELRSMFKYSSKVKYLDDSKMPMYKNKDNKERWHPGFIDPYYNIAGYRSKIGKEYIEKIASNEGVNTIAFLRNVLFHLRRMLIDGQIISEIDIIAKDYDEIKKTIQVTPTGDDHNQAAKKSAETMYKDGGTFGLPGLMMEQGIIEGIKTYFTFDGVGEQTAIEAVSRAVGDEDGAAQLYGLIEDLPDTYKRSFCSRLVLPVLMATVEGHESFNNMINNYNLNELNGLTAGSGLTSNKPMTPIGKYCKGMNSVGLLSFSKTKTDPETTSDSQKLWNYIMKEAYTKLADDPQAYTLHSYYDMLINDKRGRLIRAFPTYYIVFMDEGRKIGSWKLFDNFYNMNAISEITVSKSRKIPADTCSFVMSNMYNSFAAEYDNTTRQQYVDVYGLRDVFNSIFCPESYFTKEDSLRRRKENLETVVLQPGVRIHVRMGYGSDASRLPIAFNGKIAEIDVSEVVQVVAQGDAIELCNPLNTLGETDAVSLTESQQWTTMFKDIRGSLKRGGESPRNLLAKLTTAKYGGVLKTVTRELSNERWFGDNPFGIYHFGDNRFKHIFAEGETVQNMYEVCDANLLKGVNELYTSRENVMATPTINTTLQDKSFWDILQLCANSGVNYIGAVRDFGMRSTICLCKPNHYYAYTYKKIDDSNGQSEGKIIERRKPFQQFHYYDSYTDIVYNSIKASEKNMKTNAVGLWESTDMFWGKSQSTVGPIYLDFNIYPEHQKSMTVDTTLISDGTGGLELNLLTHFSEKWATDEKDTKVNKALAERVTTNVLRESVSNMYCGELCVLGDTSIKPHDRFYVNDTYEDMMGYMEVEAVVFSMNSATGFTTTIYPDTIVRTDDPLESAVRMVNGTMVASCALAGAGRLCAINTFARMDSVLIRTLSTTANFLAATPTDEALATFGASALGKFLHIEKFGKISEAAGAALKAGISTASIITTLVAAAGIYVCAMNTKSWISSFLKHINALTVYPIIKNQRPLIAGMSGHKGSVYGYEYTEQDADDSLQGLIVNVVDWLNGSDKYQSVFPFNFGDMLMDALTLKVDDGNGNKISEYERVKQRWSQTLPLSGQEPGQFDINAEGVTFEQKREALMQSLYTPACLEFGARDSKIQFLRTKYRIPSLQVDKADNLADEVYKRYHITGVTTVKQLSTDKKILALYPIEDEPEIKQALVDKSHPVIDKLYIAHSQGNAKVQMPFESGNRIIKFFTEQSGDSYVYDLPMLQEDALIILKLILNHEALTKKQVSFLSGTRVNDINTWKSTGFSFIIDSNDKGALGTAIEGVLKDTMFLNNKKNQAIFEYKKVDTGYLIIVYAPKDTYTS